jgi:dCTP deaminase
MIHPFNPERIEHGSYELGLGPEAFVTSDGNDPKLSLGTDEEAIIPPGQFGLLLTEETVHIPDDLIAFISIKASIKFRGLVNVSGFHVDPGFHGRLIFAVYNAGSQPIRLSRGQPVFLIWFSAMDGLNPPHDGAHQGQNTISSETVMRIQGVVASPAELKRQIDSLRTDYDRRLTSVEKSETIMRWLVGALFLFILGMILKPALELLLKRP